MRYSFAETITHLDCFRQLLVGVAIERILHATDRLHNGDACVAESRDDVPLSTTKNSKLSVAEPTDL